MITDCIKDGFALANRNLQLVVIRIVITLINLFALLVFIGVPLVAVIAYLGFDLANAKELFPYLLNNPLEFISKYLWAVFIAGVSMIFYIIFVSMINLYMTGGTLGVLKNASSGSDYRFTLSLFFKEAGGNFGRLFRLLSLLSLFFIAILIVMAIAGGAGIAASQFLKASGSLIAIFFSSFLTVTVIVTGILVFMAGFMFAVFSMMISVMEGKGAVESIRETYDFLKSRPGALLFYFILMAGVILISMIFFGVKLPFGMIPFLGPFVNIAITIGSSVIQGYLAVFVWSSLIAYYVKTKAGIAGPGIYEAG